MRWLGLIVILAAAACGQDDSFHAPDPGNLFKVPYDFAAEKYPRDLHFDDDAAMPFDLGESDLPASIDMTPPRDMRSTESTVDMTHN